MTALLLTALLTLLQPAEAIPSLDETLKLMQSAGQQLQTLQAKIEMAEDEPALGSFFIRKGWIALEAGAQTRMRATFEQKQVGNQIRDEKVEYLLEGPWLIDREHESKIEVKRRVLKEGEKLDLLKLGEGPFPLPIGQDPAEVKRLFTPMILEAVPEDPPGTTHIELTPRPGTRLAEQFQKIGVWVDQSNGMPRRIETFNVDGPIQSTDFLDVKVNEKLPADVFKLPAITGDWNQQVVEE